MPYRERQCSSELLHETRIGRFSGFESSSIDAAYRCARGNFDFDASEIRATSSAQSLIARAINQVDGANGQCFRGAVENDFTIFQANHPIGVITGQVESV